MKKYIQYFLFLLLAILLFLPIFLVKDNISLSTNTDYLFLTHRLLGLYAFTLIFLQIILGSGKDLLGKYFPQAKILKFHMASGKIAFSLALLHPVFIYATFLTEGNLEYLWAFTSGIDFYYYLFGWTAISLLIISVLAAIYRFKIGPKWIYLHRVNYLIFWLIFFHSQQLGVDTKGELAVIFYKVAGIIVAALTARRILEFAKSSHFLKFLTKHKVT